MNGYETAYYLLELNGRTLDDAYIVEHEIFIQIKYPQKLDKEGKVYKGVCSFFFYGGTTSYCECISTTR